MDSWEQLDNCPFPWYSDYDTGLSSDYQSTQIDRIHHLRWVIYRSLRKEGTFSMAEHMAMGKKPLERTFSSTDHKVSLQNKAGQPSCF